jgi:hypothetical protein
MKWAFAFLCAAIAGAARADELDTLVAAYPQTLSGRDDRHIVFRDGTALDAGRLDSDVPFETVLRAPSIRDQFLLAYPVDRLTKPPVIDDDPGRIRNKAFFDHMYGDCRKGEVEPHLVTITWLPRSADKRIEITSVNGVAEALKAVSREIDALPRRIRRAAYPIAGTYVCRSVADNSQPSMHAYGAAIDLNLAYSSYWYWDDPPRYRNTMPQAIIDIFERHGFIWGGKWYHYDTMHFEYRPELLPLAQPTASR